MKTYWKKIGSCSVDSGLLILADPCYIMAKNKIRTIDDNQKDYNELIEEIWNDSNTNKQAIHHTILCDIAGDGVIFSTQYGDGCYDVFGKFKKNKDGTESMIEVKIKI